MQKVERFIIVTTMLTLVFFVSSANLCGGEESENVPEISLDKTLRTLEDSFKKTSEGNKKLKKQVIMGSYNQGNGNHRLFKQYNVYNPVSRMLL